MSITAEELRLLDVFRKNPLKSLEFNKIMELSKKKSRGWVFDTLQDFSKRDLIRKIKVNNSYLYKANLNSTGLISLFHPLDFFESEPNSTKWKKDIYDILDELKRNITKVTPYFTLMVFGSYAEKKQNEKSDLDIAILINSKEIKIVGYIEKVVRKEIINIDYHIITKDDFKEMLLREEENLGKEIFKKHLIIWGNDQYYELIREAEENGFTG